MAREESLLGGSADASRIIPLRELIFAHHLVVNYSLLTHCVSF